MIWWATQPSRARQERAAIANLEETAPWLSNVRWGFSKSFVLSADFEIVIDGNALEFTIIYPEFFPDAPPSIKPLAEVRISGHQYGAGGDLCLEYRADNWAPAITGAMMIESTYRLISGELDPQAEPVPSAHRTTLGQEVRASFLRLLLSSGAQAALASLPERTPLDAALVEHQFGETWITAYAGRCAISRLPEQRLLDAAHIVADKHERLGQAVVPNGLPLSKLHHAAFDAHLIGIDPDYRLHVSPRLLEQRDGPMLEALKQLQGRSLHFPARERDYPDRDRLALRFERFRSAA